MEATVSSVVCKKTSNCCINKTLCSRIKTLNGCVSHLQLVELEQVTVAAEGGEQAALFGSEI